MASDRGRYFWLFSALFEGFGKGPRGRYTWPGGLGARLPGVEVLEENFRIFDFLVDRSHPQRRPLLPLPDCPEKRSSVYLVLVDTQSAGSLCQG
jgi:hypothetical protein